MMSKINFIINNTTQKTVEATVGLSILEIARQNSIFIEGACDGAMACATCHVIIDDNFYSKLPPPSESEEDMLDSAFGLTKTSRLSCQIIFTKELEGIKVYLFPVV